MSEKIFGREKIFKLVQIKPKEINNVHGENSSKPNKKR